MAYKRPERQRVGYSYWIIVNRVRQSIWIGDRDTCVFATEAEAVAEYRKQVLALRSGVKTNYAVERMDAPGGSVADREQAKQEQVDSLEAFAAAAQGASLPYKDNHGA